MSTLKYNVKFAKYVILYLWITYLIYLILPYDMDRTGIKEIYTIVFLGFVSLSFFLGCSSVKPYGRNATGNSNNEELISDTTLFVFLTLSITFTAFYIRDMISQGLGALSLNLGENYVSYQRNEANNISLWGQLYVLFSPVRFFLIPYCIIVFKKMSKVATILFFIFLVVTFLHSLIQGKNVGLGYIVLMIGVAYFLVCLQKNSLQSFKRYAIIGGVLFVVYFILSTSLRVEAYGGSFDDHLISKDNWIIRLFGIEAGSGVLKLFNYFSHGYKGLNYCLQMPFEWTYGYGGAMGLDSYISQYLHVPSQLDNTYPVRMEMVYNYSGLQSWPTAFPWWASDLSFPGVVVFMYFIGRFMCVLLRDALSKSDTFSAVMFSYFFIMIACLPLNNQLMQTRPTFLTTTALLIIWLFRTNSRVQRKKQYSLL